MSSHKIFIAKDLNSETIEIEADSQAEVEQLYKFLKNQED